MKAWRYGSKITGFETTLRRNGRQCDLCAPRRPRRLPNAIWIALWDKRPTLSDGSLAWPLSARAKQYAGNVDATVKGITLTVDKDIVGGPVARLLTPQVHLHRQDTAVHANLVRMNRR